MSCNNPGEVAVRRHQRLIFRCAMDFLLDEAGRIIRRHDGDFIRGAVFLAIAQATRAPAGTGADEPVRVISVRALAQSMSLAYETTRRKVAELEARGLCLRAGNGLTASPAAFEGETYRQACEETWQGLKRLIGELRAIGFDFSLVGAVSAQAGRGQTPDDLAQASAALVGDFTLRVLEGGAGPHGSILDAVLATAMMIANAELLTHDPELAWKYAGAETPPPDALRRPVSIAQMAARLGLSHETVRRRVKRFVELGWARRETGGYLFSMARQQDPAVIQTGLVVSQRFLQLLQALRQIGVDLEAG